MNDFPPNSDKSKAPDPKRVERITTSEPIRRQKPLGRKLRETFIAGDPKSAISVAVLAVLVPAAKDAITEAASRAVEGLIYGESRGSGRRRPSGPPSGHNGYVSYNRMSSGSPTPRDRAPMRRSRDAFEFEEIILVSRAEADNAIENMFTILEKYDSVSVADLYEMLGLKVEFTDQKWGWRSLQGAAATRTRQGYLLDLPDPEPLA